MQAVIFDWYGTLANPHGASSYESVLSEFGYEVDEEVMGGYMRHWDGVDHREHSVSEEAYLAWTRQRLGGLVSHCGVVDSQASAVVDALINVDYRNPIVVFEDVIPTLSSLRARGVTIGICSNWGWDLETFLETTGVNPFVDVAITSARAGVRKPHPEIYKLMLESLDIEAEDAVFVGDSWGPDVLGPTSVGMEAVHLLRDNTREAPELVPGSSRVSNLDQLLAIIEDAFK